MKQKILVSFVVVVLLVTVFSTMYFFKFPMQLPFQLMCQEWQGDTCASYETKYQTCYQTCHDVKIDCKDEFWDYPFHVNTKSFTCPATKWDFIYSKYVNVSSCLVTLGVSVTNTLGSQYSASIQGQSSMLYQVYQSGSVTIYPSSTVTSQVTCYNVLYGQKITTSCTPLFDSGVIKYDHIIYYTKKTCTSTPYNYNCNPYQCKPTQVCTNWNTQTYLADPSSDTSIKNIQCSKQIETCGNNICELQYGENEQTCLGDCYVDKCAGFTPSTDICFVKSCDGVTGVVTSVPSNTSQCICTGTQISDEDICTTDTVSYENGQCTVTHTRVVSDKCNPLPNNMLFSMIAISAIIAIVAVVVIVVKKFR